MHIFEVSDDGSFRRYNKQNVLPGPLKIKHCVLEYSHTKPEIILQINKKMIAQIPLSEPDELSFLGFRKLDQRSGS
jgi:hypothetical protein